MEASWCTCQIKGEGPELLKEGWDYQLSSRIQSPLKARAGHDQGPSSPPCIWGKCSGA